VTAQGADEGFVYAATGERYIDLARHAARTLRAVAPKTIIDLWCDTGIEDETFDRVHLLDRTTHRPKFEALRRSRFQRTVYLDADTIAVADPSDIFFVLTRFDVAGAHVGRRNNGFCRSGWRRDFPLAFPQINGGVLGIRKSEATDAFLASVDAALAETGARKDQPILRELLFDSDLRIAVLPPEYNCKQLHQIATWTDADAAPRILHVPELHKRRDPESGRIPRLSEIYPASLLTHVDELLASDAYLRPKPRPKVRALADRPIGRRIKARLRRTFGNGSSITGDL
jgi:hypothetical protein